MGDTPEGVGIVIDDAASGAQIAVDTRLFSEDVALRAAYWLSERGYIHFSRRDEETLVAEIKLKDGCDRLALTALCGDFCNGLIDFALRARISAETQDIQAALLQRAFVELVPKPASGN